jgi:hypothetical protein
MSFFSSPAKTDSSTQTDTRPAFLAFIEDHSFNTFTKELQEGEKLVEMLFHAPDYITPDHAAFVKGVLTLTKSETVAGICTWVLGFIDELTGTTPKAS